MKRSRFLIFLFCIFFSVGSYCQEGFSSEEELKEKATELFENKKFSEAEPLFAQLLSLYPKDPSYNFKYGACLLASSADKEKPLKYLNFAASKPNTDPLAFYYLGRAHHLNYHFAKAIKSYKRFQSKVNSSTAEEYQLERKIEMCKNGNDLLSRINEVQVLEKQVINEDNFFRIYKLEGIDGKIVKKPKEFMSKYDEKIGESSIIYLPNNAREVYFSSYGKKGENRRDIFKVVKLGNDKWSEAVNLGSSINTAYDENYPFIHPDGRTLYFASEGHNSMGGYDLFMSTYDESIADWTEPVNLDFAFSSVDNDVLFITDKNKSIAYFASNRTNKSGEITVYKVMVNKAPAELTVIKGELIVEGGEPPKSARVTVVDRETNQTVGSFKADDNGKYQIEIPKNGGEYKFVLETTADAPIHTGIIEVPKQDEFEVLGQELRLVGSGANQQLVIKNIFDGSAADQYASAGPKISAELLKKKADLNVNLDADEIATAEESSKIEGQEEPKDKIETKADLAEENQSQEQTEDNREAEPEVGVVTDSELSELIKQLEKQNRQEESKINAAYSIAAKRQDEAEMSFSKLNETASSSDKQVYAQAKKEAELKAFDAAIALSLAQELEAENEKTKKLLGKARQTEESWSQLEKDEGEEQLASLKKEYSLISDEKEFIQSKQKQIDDELLSAKDELTNIKEGVKHISEEQTELNQRIVEKREELYQVESDEEQKQVESQLENLQLDSADLAFQMNKLAVDKRSVENNISAFERQKGKLVAWNKDIEETSTKVQTVPENEKLALKNSVKQYKDEGKIAYLASNKETKDEIVENTVNTNESSKSNIATEEESEREEGQSLSETNSTVESINEEYEEQFLQAKEVSNESAITSLEKWNEELDRQMIQKESRLTQTESESEILSLQNEIDQILQQKEVNEQRKNSLSPKQELVKRASTEEEKGSEAITENTNPSESKVQSNIDVSSVDADSEINDDFTTLNFEKKYTYTNEEARSELSELKKSLYEASDLAQKAEQAQEAAYSLPTVEERTKAFEDANAFKKASEDKLLQAATKFKEVNSKEYFSNLKTLLNANKYSQDFESDNLDMANLLAEEAEVYFAQAAEVRATINPNDRFSRQEVALQKAYDYEMMAINKQREALELLDLVDDEFAKSEKFVGELPQNGTFIQSIMDPEVLKISSAEIAKDKGDEIQLKAGRIQAKADSIQLEAEKLPVGSERDELLAEVETIRNEADRLEKQANVYYQREAQIERGIVDGKTGDYLGKGIQTPLKSSVKVDIDTIQVEESKAEQIMQSNAYVQYLQEAKENKQLKKSAQVEYEKALEIQKEQLQLKIDAQELRKEAAKNESSEQTERLIKEAIVLEQKAESMSKSIDSINKITRVRNYLIQESDRKLNRQLAELDEFERKAVVSLAAKNIDEPIDEDLVARVEAKGSENDQSELGADVEEQKEQTVAREELVNTDGSESESESRSESDEDLAITADTILEDGQAAEETEVTTKAEVEEINGIDEDVQEQSEEIADDVRNEESDLIESDTPEEDQVEDSTDEIIEETIESPIEKTEEAEPTNELRSIVNIEQIPRKLETSIFNRLNQPTSVYNRENPIPRVNKEDLPEGLVYKVQVGAFRNPIPQDMFKGFAPLSAQEGPNGITRYTAGFFNRENDANSARDQIRDLGYRDAFVVAFYNGERIGVSRAREIENNLSSATVNDEFNLADETEEAPIAANEKDEQGRIKVEAIEGVFFTVQIGVFSKPLEAGTFSEYEPLNVVLLSNGMRRYNSGVYRTAQEAEEAKARISEVIKDAFVTAYYQGKRITLNEAARLQNR